MIYVEKFGGYIADNPNIDFERCDGRIFSYDEVNTSGFTNGTETVTINGGQGGFPVAILDTTKTLEFTYDISNFTTEIFEMANAVTGADADYGTRETKRYDVTTGLVITIPYEVKAGSVKITGLTEVADTVTSGKFKVAITASGTDTAGSTTITLDAGDASVGDTIRVSYIRRVVDGHRVSVKTTSTTAKGELWAHYPVYSSGFDCSEAAVKGWVHINIFRVRVTATPGISSSYKSAQTYSVTFAGIDPKRADGKMWDLTFEPTDTNGDIVNKSSAATVDWN